MRRYRAHSTDYHYDRGLIPQAYDPSTPGYFEEGEKLAASFRRDLVTELEDSFHDADFHFLSLGPDNSPCTSAVYREIQQNINIHRSGEEITISVDPSQIATLPPGSAGASVYGSVTYDIQDITDNFRHNFVFSFMSDIVRGRSFREVGLTSFDSYDSKCPDLIVTSGVSYAVVEFGTNLTYSPNDAMDAYLDKSTQYQLPCESRAKATSKILYGTILVYSEGVITNLKSISSNDGYVRELVVRLHIARAIESELINLGLLSKPVGMWTLKEKAVLASLKELGKQRIAPEPTLDKLFSPGLRQIGSYTPSAQDATVYHNMLRNELNEAKLAAEVKVLGAAHLGRVAHNQKMVADLDPYYNAFKEKALMGARRKTHKAPIILPLFNIEPEDNPRISFDHPIMSKFIGCSNDPAYLWIESAITCMKSEDLMFKEDESREKDIALSLIPEPAKKTHKTPGRFEVSAPIPENVAIELAKDGLHAKSLIKKFRSQIEGARLPKHFPLSWDNDISYLEPLMTGTYTELLEPALVSNDARCDLVKGLIEDALKLHSEWQHELVMKPLSLFMKTRLGLAARIISDIATELMACLKQNTTGDKVILKKTRYFPLFMIVCPSSSKGPMFFSLFCEYKDVTWLMDSPLCKPFNTNSKKTLLWTDLLSVDEAKLNNWLTFESACMTFMMEAMDSWSVPYTITLQNTPEPADMMNLCGSDFNKVCSHVNLLAAIHLHDKPATERMVSLLRYIILEALKAMPDFLNLGPLIDDINPAPRSELELFISKRSLDHIRYLTERGGYASRTLWGGGQMSMKHPISHYPIDQPQQLFNLFYAGYTTNKNATPQGNTDFGIYEKILEEEKKLRRDADGTVNVEYLGVGIPPQDMKAFASPHEFDRLFVQVIGQYIASKVFSERNVDMKEEVGKRFCETFANSTIEDVFTFHASSKFTPERHFHKKEPYHREAVATYLMRYVRENPDDVYLHQTWAKCLTKCEEEGGLHACTFQKHQHGSIREILVMRGDARLVQHAVEKLFRIICSYLPNEVVSNESRKSFVPRQHDGVMRRTAEGRRIHTTSVSDDAKRWSQTQTVTKFYLLARAFIPDYLEPLVWRTLRLWGKKHIMIKPEILSRMEDFNRRGVRPVTQSPLFNEFFDAFNGATQPYMPKINGKQLRLPSHIVTTSGMLQGLWHSGSSLFHSCEATWLLDHSLVWLSTTSSSCLKNPPKWKGYSLVGSDDSSLTLSVHYTSFTELLHAQILASAVFKVKGVLASRVGMHESVKKKKSNTPDFREFYSVFGYHGEDFHPYAKFLYACMQMPVCRTFVDRMMTFNGAISACIENGAPFLVASLVQVAQAMLHYRLLGSANGCLFKLYAEAITVHKNPALGYFLMCPPMAAGVAGLSYSYWNCVEKTEPLQQWLNYKIFDHAQEVIPGKPSHVINNRIAVAKGGELMGRYNLIFGGDKKWQRLCRMSNIRANWKQTVEADPRILFKRADTPDELFTRLCMKYYTPEAVESLTRGPQTYQSFNSCLYIMQRSCLTEADLIETLLENKITKKSLLFYATRCPPMVMPLLEDSQFAAMFPLLNEFKLLKSRLQIFEKPHLKNEAGQFMPMISHLILRRPDQTRLRLPSRVQVLNQETSYSVEPLKAMGWRWFGITYERHDAAQYDFTVDLIKFRISWIKDTFEETLDASPFSTSMQLANFIMKLDYKRRQISILGTPGSVHSGYTNLISALINNTWPNVVFSEAHDIVARMHSDKNADLMSIAAHYCKGPVSRENASLYWEELARERQDLVVNVVPGSEKSKIDIMQYAARNPTNLREVHNMIQNLGDTLTGWYEVRQNQILHGGRLHYEGLGRWVGYIDRMKVSFELDSVDDYLSRVPCTYIRQIFLSDRDPTTMLKLARHLEDWCLSNHCTYNWDDLPVTVLPDRKCDFLFRDRGCVPNFKQTKGAIKGIPAWVSLKATSFPREYNNLRMRVEITDHNIRLWHYKPLAGTSAAIACKKNGVVILSIFLRDSHVQSRYSAWALQSCMNQNAFYRSWSLHLSLNNAQAGALIKAVYRSFVCCKESTTVGLLVKSGLSNLGLRQMGFYNDQKAVNWWRLFMTTRLQALAIIRGPTVLHEFVGANDPGAKVELENAHPQGMVDLMSDPFSVLTSHYDKFANQIRMKSMMANNLEAFNAALSRSFVDDHLDMDLLRRNYGEELLESQEHDLPPILSREEEAFLEDMDFDPYDDLNYIRTGGADYETNLEIAANVIEREVPTGARVEPDRRNPYGRRLLEEEEDPAEEVEVPGQASDFLFTTRRSMQSLESSHPYLDDYLRLMPDKEIVNSIYHHKSFDGPAHHSSNPSLAFMIGCIVANVLPTEVRHRLPAEVAEPEDFFMGDFDD